MSSIYEDSAQLAARHTFGGGERSKTKKILDTFINSIQGSDIKTIDLTKSIPDFFLTDNLAAYFKRDYNGQPLNENEAAQLKKMDEYTQQVLDADIVILSFPLWNYGPPAVVKAWADSIALKGKTWDMNEIGSHN